MKALLVLLLCVSMLTLSGQPPSRETITLGSVRLYLGMAKNSVINGLQQDGFILVPMRDNLNGFSVERGRGNEEKDVFGIVQFNGNGLMFVNREWTPTSIDGAAVVHGLYGAVSQYAKAGNVNCLITPRSGQTPELQSYDVNFQCGSRKRITVSVVTVNGVDFANVSEILMTDPSK